MKVTCEDIASVLGSLAHCVQTSEGTQVATHCLYPSFDQVRVYVVRVGEEYRVHDGGGAVRSAWEHSREGAVIQRALLKQANRYGLKIREDTLECDVKEREWLGSAIMAVANASAAAAGSAVEHAVAAAENLLRQRIAEVLESTITSSKISEGFELVGASGKQHRFDFGVSFSNDNLLLVDAVTPHHVSVSSKYVAFADSSRIEGMLVQNMAVFDRRLSEDDVSLLQQVTAAIVPIGGLREGIKLIAAR